MNISGAVLVTGATGFVGSAVARHLAEAGYDVKVLARAGTNMSNLEGVDVEARQGDLTDTGSLRAAMHDCRGVFHVAADYRLWTRNPDTMYAVNVDGTRELLLAAAQAGVERIVYTSSVATLGVNADHSPADERTPTSLEAMIGHYKRSKFLAEAEVKRLVDEHDIPAVTVNPSAPVGPRDRRPTPTGRTILDAARGRMQAYVDTGLNIVHVDDVAAGHVLAYEQGRAGERYILGGDNMTLYEIINCIAGLINGKRARLRLPHTLLEPVAYASETWARLSGREPLLTVDGLRLSRKYMFFSSAKAQRELGYQARPAQQGISDALDWYRDNGYLGGC